MRGGRFQQKSNEDSNTRNAEVLFETRSVVEVREVESRTRKDIEEKKEELRQLVGASYRDLIESADSILNMRRSCEAVATNVALMEKGFASLRSTIATTTTAPGADEARKRRERLYNLGSRVKYLVDTPEKIWGCLDEHMYLEGAERFMRAREVYSLLVDPEKNDQKELLAAFPLLRHQWPLVQGFKDQISQRSRDRLQETDLGVNSYAVGLAAVAIIDGLSSEKTFQLFLESRRTWITAQLKTASSTSLDSSDIIAILCRLVRFIEISLCQAGELFLEVSTGKVPLLFSTVLQAPPGSQLFGGIPNPDGEVQLWRAQSEQMEASVAPLEGKMVQETCQEWLRLCSEEIGGEGLSLLAQMKTASQLAAAEHSVRAEIASQLPFKDSLEWLTSAYGAAPGGHPWDSVCELLLRGPVDLWQMLFEKIFTQRAKLVIDASFAELKIADEVGACLEEVQPPAEVVEVSPGGAVLPNGMGAAGEVDGLEGSGGLAWRVAGDEKDWSRAKHAYFSPEVTRLRDSIDDRLLHILEDVKSMLEGPGGASRTKLLGPYLQEQCSAFVKSLVADLDWRLESLSGSATDGYQLTPLIVEKSLLIGRFCAALGQYSSSLPFILGSPASWTASHHPSTSDIPRRCNSWLETEDPPSSLRRVNSRRATNDWSSRGGGDDGAMKLRDLQREMRRVSISAHRVWVGWTTRQLVTTFSAQLARDETLATTAPLKGWEETVLRQEEEGGAPVEMRMSLPGQPSPYCLQLLFRACREIHRAGSHTLDRAVLRLFAWRLSQEVLETYENLSRDTASMDSLTSEKGVLQLLFDIRLLNEVLQGGADITPEMLQALDDDDSWGTPPRVGALAAKRPKGGPRFEKTERQRRMRFSAVESSLTSRLDPIDWATYEQYLWGNEARYYQRCSVLLGALVHLHRLHTALPSRQTPASDTNTLDTAPTVPRFVYLPISAPTLPSKATAVSVRRPALLEVPDLNTWTTAGADVSRFSFADATGLPSIGAAKPLFKSIMGQVGSGALKLGSMVSDGQVGRNISTLGDMLPAHAAGLFSFTTGTKADQ